MLIINKETFLIYKIKTIKLQIILQNLIKNNNSLMKQYRKKKMITFNLIIINQY